MSNSKSALYVFTRVLKIPPRYHTVSFLKESPFVALEYVTATYFKLSPPFPYQEIPPNALCLHPWNFLKGFSRNRSVQMEAL